MTTRTTRTTRTLRDVVLGGVPPLAAAAVLLTTLLWTGELPDRVAVHWALDGTADGTAPLWLATLVSLLLVGTFGVVLPLLGRRGVTGAAARTLHATAVGGTVGAAGLHLSMLSASYGVSVARGAQLDEALRLYATLPGEALLLTSAAAVVAGLAASRLPVDDLAGPEVLDPVEVDVEPGEAVVWTGRAAGGPALHLPALATTLATLWFVLLQEPFAATTMGVVTLVVVSVLRVRVTVGPAGVVARLGVYRRRVDLADVRGVTAEHVEPMAFGGWGMRRLPGVRALVVRRGPGLRIEVADGPDLVVTVDDARTVAGVLLAHLQAQPA